MTKESNSNPLDNTLKSRDNLERAKGENLGLVIGLPPEGDSVKNDPIAETEIAPSRESLQILCQSKRKYIQQEQITKFAVSFWDKHKRGFTYKDVTESGLARDRGKAQRMIKYALCTTHLIFTHGGKKPQAYYPSCRRAEIIDYLKHQIKGEKEKYVQKIAPLDHTGVNDPKPPKHEEIDNQRANNLLEVLMLLPNYPLHIHKIQLKLFIHKEFYDGIKDLQCVPDYKSKPRMSETRAIGGRKVVFQVYPCGTVMVYVTCSTNPFRLQTEEDEIVLFAFLGQVKERLVSIIDNIEAYIPSLMEWFLTACDVNKDVEIRHIPTVWYTCYAANRS